MNAPCGEARHEVEYSIVVPVYHNEGTLTALHEALLREVAARRPQADFEIIYVDDGSRDGSLAELLRIKAADPQRVRVVKFSRNFGQVAAIMAGYRLAVGRCVVNISADLQDPPQLIHEMLENFFTHGYEVVICHRAARDESLFRSITSRVSYSVIKRLSFPDMPPGGFDFVLLSERVKRILLEMDEANAFWQAQILWTGFPRKLIPYTRQRRPLGRSRWSFGRKLKYFIDGIMGYSYLPIRLISLMGVVVALLGLGYAAVVAYERLVGRIPVKGWAPLVILILVLSGVQMLMLGVIGEYLWRVLDQVRHRRPYLIERIY